MKKLLTILFISTIFANVTNNGAILTINEGVSVVVNGDFTNNGTVNNQGSININGSYLGEGSLNNEGIFLYEGIYGCTNEEAENYESNALIDDGSCCVKLWGDYCYNIAETTMVNRNNSSLVGEIPVQICELVNLTYLNLHSNQLTGEIPECIGDLIYLYEFYLYDNQLSGEIPQSIGNLVNV